MLCMIRFPILFLLLMLLFPTSALAILTAAPLTWNVIGLDSNSPASGPRFFPVGARICSDAPTSNVAVNYVWDSANSNVNLRSGSLSTLTFASMGAGSCQDAYFEAEVTPVAAAYGTARRYHITATDSSGTVSTPTARELYVEHLISQNRNSITNIRFGTDPLNLTSVPSGGAMNFLVGNTYTIELSGGTATQGYEQFEAFINFSNTIFQILSVSTTYSANTSVYVTSPSDKLYADACLWDNNPNSPNYRSCVGMAGKTGGTNVVTTYTIRILSGGGTTQTLNTLLFDFSGSSFHYNADYSSSARMMNIIDPAAATITKSFSPNPATLDGVSALSITITNPNSGVVSGYSFVDNLPTNMIVANPPVAATVGCGTPTLVATSGASSISFSNGTVAAGGSCVIKVNVTPTVTGSLINTTGPLFVDSLNTGLIASATLTVNNDPPPGTGVCGLTMARWNFPTGMSTTAPVPTIANVMASAAPGTGINSVASSNDNTIVPAGTGSWGSNGAIAAAGAVLDTSNNDYFEFAVDTTGYTAVYLSFDASFKTMNGPKGLAVYYGTTNTRPETGTSLFNNANALSTQNNWVSFGSGNSIAATSGLNPSGPTYFRIYGFNAGNSNPGSDLNLDNVLFTDCSAPIKPIISKTFAPNPVAINGISTLAFALTNPNAVSLTGAQFIDPLPAGVEVAAIPAASTTCGNSPTWAPTAGATTLNFGQVIGATVPASGSCTVSVNVVATTAGPKNNVSGFLSTTESGTTTTSVASASLTAVLPPIIAKKFESNPVLAGAISTLTFTISNPNQNDVLNGIAFTDTYPAGLLNAPTPAATNNCGGTFTAIGGSSTLALIGAGPLAGCTSCTLTVNAIAANPGNYVNSTGNISHLINAATVVGNTATASLIVNAATPSISLLKQVGPSASGPWSSFLGITPGNPVYYRFTVENTGDVALNPINLSDNTLDVASCNATWAALTLPVPVVANENHIASCVIGPVTSVTDEHINIANASGNYMGTPTNSPNDIASYASTNLSIVKSATQSNFTVAGDIINYQYLVTNTGAAPLEEPVFVADDHTTVTCPDVNTTGDLDDFLDPGESLVCTASYTINAVDVSSGSVTNIASASVDGVSSPTTSVTVPAAIADVSLVKTGPSSVTGGAPIIYNLLITNAGPSNADGATYSDPMPLGITGVNASCNLPSGGATCAVPSVSGSDVTGYSVTGTIPSLPSGGSVTVVITGTAPPGSPQTLDNTATTSLPVGLTDPTPNNNSGSASLTTPVQVLYFEVE